jgi:hypothetical protein
VSFACVNGACAAADCRDLRKNGGETDIDCGGATSGCPKCAPGKTCTVGADCDGGNCMGGSCQAASCRDGIRNGAETGVDCGGAGCPPCGDGIGCQVAADCASGVCPAALHTCAAPACADLVKNGSETDVDCGGTCAPAKPCADGKSCGTGGDCASGVCTAGVCAVPSCSDLVRNGTETDVNCGGSCPMKCAAGKLCGASDANCADGVCTNGTCQGASCGDAVKNGTETDLNCGGSCAKCGDGKMCLLATDCTSGVCTLGLCAVPSCTDTVKNGTETDLNCGGSCPACGDGKVCGVSTDCTSGVCTSGLCAMPSCLDTVKNGTETDLNCGGSCPACANGRTCLMAADCASGICPTATHLCTAPSCDDTLRNGSETDVDCGGSCAPLKTCADNLMCLVGGDCASASCVSMRCAAAGCQTCWKVQYKNRDANTAQQTLLALNVVSIGSTPVPLAQLKIRYWFTAESGGMPVSPQDCDYGDPSAGSCSNVTMQMVSIAPRTNANTYWEIGFLAGTLAPGGNAGEIQLRFHVGNFALQDHSNDYSWSTQTALADWNKVTLYNNGVLVWGIEPP